jgi:hypothetical protein
MFSNLRTEGGVSNHFIIPANVQPFDYQKQVVKIVSSTDPGLQKLALENKALVLFEFKNYVHAYKPARIEYLLDGKQQTYARDDKSTHRMLKPNPYILSKVMKFRPFEIAGPQTCSH